MLWALAVTETISYGVLYCSFAAFLLPMQQSLDFSQITLHRRDCLQGTLAPDLTVYLF
jgi:hypothetical protein